MFEAKESPLVLKDFSILDSFCEVVYPQDENSEVISTPSIHIDFNINKGEGQNDIFIIFVEVELNKDKKPGYHSLVNGAAIFSISDNNISREDRDTLLLRSGVSICITNIRSYIANMTSYYPMGKYQFPAIDMNDLINQKRAEQSSTSQE